VTTWEGLQQETQKFRKRTKRRDGFKIQTQGPEAMTPHSLKSTRNIRRTHVLLSRYKKENTRKLLK